MKVLGEEKAVEFLKNLNNVAEDGYHPDFPEHLKHIPDR